MCVQFLTSCQLVAALRYASFGSILMWRKVMLKKILKRMVLRLMVRRIILKRMITS